MTHKSPLQERPSLLVLQYWTQSVELDIRAGKFEDAFSALAEVGDAFLVSAYTREFTRATRMLLDAIDWVVTYNKYQVFDVVFRIHVHILSDLGEHQEVDRLLDKYEITVANKDTRYINYCDLRCYASWVRGEFESAIVWGQRGQELKTSERLKAKNCLRNSRAGSAMLRQSMILRPNASVFSGFSVSPSISEKARAF